MVVDKKYRGEQHTAPFFGGISDFCALQDPGERTAAQRQHAAHMVEEEQCICVVFLSVVAGHALDSSRPTYTIENRQADGEIQYVRVDGHPERQTERLIQTHTHREIRVDGHPERQTERLIQIHTQRDTCRRSPRKTDREIDTDTHTERYV